MFIDCLSVSVTYSSRWALSINYCLFDSSRVTLMSAGVWVIWKMSCRLFLCSYLVKHTRTCGRPALIRLLQYWMLLLLTILRKCWSKLYFLFSLITLDKLISSILRPVWEYSSCISHKDTNKFERSVLYWASGDVISFVAFHW